MSTSSPTKADFAAPESNHRESVADFVRWALAQLELDFVEQNGVCRLQLAEADRGAFDDQAELQIALQDSLTNGLHESMDLSGRFGNWLVECLRNCGPAVHVRPREQPMAVNDIASRLFAGYRVDGGQVHLGGCQLSDFPFLRLSFAATDERGPCVRHLFVAYDGTSVTDRLAWELGLLDVEPVTKSPPRIDDAALDSLLAAGRRIAAKNATSRDPTAAAADPLAIALVWVKHVGGQLQFTVGARTVPLQFSGWAKLVQPQPFVASQSGTSTFHVAATDDGRIDAYEAIAVCEQSGRRVLRQELATCSVTGRRVLREYTQRCPVSGRPTLSDEFSQCSICQEHVSKSVLEKEVCAACRQMAKIKKDDPRLVWILGEHAGLDRWNRWKLAETQDVYIAQAESLLKRLFVVVDKETLAVHHLATGGKLGSTWTPVSGAVQADLLK